VFDLKEVWKERRDWKAEKTWDQEDQGN